VPVAEPSAAHTHAEQRCPHQDRAFHVTATAAQQRGEEETTRVDCMLNTCILTHLQSRTTEVSLLKQ